jgi:hypothetical protein
MRLMPLSALLQSLDAALVPVAPIALPVRSGIGLALADAVTAPGAVPQAGVALADGFAVHSLDTVGAGPSSPLPVMPPPQAVRAGDTLPADCDAVIAADHVEVHGAHADITHAAAPGEWARLPGHDLAPGRRIAAEGDTLSFEMALAAEAAGLGSVRVRWPAVSLSPPEGPAANWLAMRLVALGCDLSGERPADLVVTTAPDASPRVALNPAQSAFASIRDGVIQVNVPERFDGVVAAFAALIVPIIARLTNRVVALETRPATRKLTSQIGATDVALLARAAGGWEPLAVADLPLWAIGAAHAFALLPPDEEGLPPGAALAATAFDACLMARTEPT